MRLRFLLLTGLVLGLCVAPARAADEPADGVPVSKEWQFRAWQTDEGLPDNAVTGVAQSADGYLWVSTLGGLMRFNGDRFEAFSALHLPDVPNRVVRQLVQDSSGRLWLAMERGSLVCADRFRATVLTTQDGLRDAPPTSMTEDGSGGVWLAYRGGVVRVNDGKVSSLTLSEGFPEDGNYHVASDGKGAVWIATDNQLGRMRAGRWEAVQKFPQPNLRVAPAADAGWWVTAGNVLFHFEPGHEPVELARLPSQVQVQALLTDRAGILWIATTIEGLFQWHDGRLKKVPTSHSQISCLAEDREGNLWVGTAGGGLNRLRPRMVEVLGKNRGLPYESMRSVCEDTNGVRWAVTDNGLLLRNAEDRWAIAGPESGWTHGAVANCVTADRTGTVWVGTDNGQLVRLRDGASRGWSLDPKAGRQVRSVLVGGNDEVEMMGMRQSA